ncbi:MAG: hypothetical protein U0325_15705 [Polyangiales bacterium]
MTGWLAARERGTVAGIRFVLWLATALGRPAARAFTAVLALYYVTVHRAVRRASRAFLRRVGAPHGFWASYQHVLRFAHCAVDRVFLLRGATAGITLESHGTEHLRAAQEAGRGAVLLGAHLGSFEALRAQAGARGYPVNIVGYFKNAAMINAVLAKVAPERALRVLHLEPDGLEHVLALRERVEQGEFVAILADRHELSKRTAEVPFFGAPVRLPTGPFLLASVLKCPVFLTFGLFEEPGRYRMYCEPFADPLVIDRRDREGALRDCAARYAARLEHYARMAPDNWFNFYDYWGDA